MDAGWVGAGGRWGVVVGQREGASTPSPVPDVSAAVRMFPGRTRSVVPVPARASGWPIITPPAPLSPNPSHPTAACATAGCANASIIHVAWPNATPTSPSPPAAPPSPPTGVVVGPPAQSQTSGDLSRSSSSSAPVALIQLTSSALLSPLPPQSVGAAVAHPLPPPMPAMLKPPAPPTPPQTAAEVGRHAGEQSGSSSLSSASVPPLITSVTQLQSSRPSSVLPAPPRPSSP